MSMKMGSSITHSGRSRLMADFQRYTSLPSECEAVQWDGNIRFPGLFWDIETKQWAIVTAHEQVVFLAIG